MAGKLSQCTQQFLDDSGDPLNGGKVYYYEPDGAYSTEKAVYKDKALTTAWTQPITLGADGRPVGADIFESGDYDRKITDSSDNAIRSEPNIGDNRSAVLTDLSENLVSNGSFETDTNSDGTPDNWSENEAIGTIARTTTDNYHGTACVKGTGVGVDDRIQTGYLEISEGRDLITSLALKASNANAEPRVQYKWYDKDQAQISTDFVYDSASGNTPTSWKYVEGLRATPPANSRYAIIRLYFNNNASTYDVYFDDVRAYQPLVLPEAPYVPYGLAIERDSGDTDHDIKVKAGAVKSDDYSTDIVLSTDIIKRLDAVWAAGSNAGSGDGTSLPADGIIYIWLIKNSSTGAVDVLTSTSATSPSMPSGFDVKRRLGGWLCDSSNNLIAGENFGAYFVFDEAIVDLNDTSTASGTIQTVTLASPPGSTALLRVELNSNGAGSELNWILVSADAADPTSSVRSHQVLMDTANVEHLYNEHQVKVNDSSQIKVKFDYTSASLDNFTIRTYGFIDHKRDYPQ